MDYPLGAFMFVFIAVVSACLNPYSNGLPSRGAKLAGAKLGGANVLIPILMDYPLGAEGARCLTRTKFVLIPILMDYPLGEKG